MDSKHQMQAEALHRENRPESMLEMSIQEIKKTSAVFGKSQQNKKNEKKWQN